MSWEMSDADWRAMRRAITVFQSGLAAELARIQPDDLVCEAPDPRAYFILPTRDDVRANTYDTFPVSISVHPASARTLTERTRGTDQQSQPQGLDVTFAIRTMDRPGPDYVEDWKTLTPKEREYRRALVYLGAVNNLMFGASAGPTAAQDPTRIGRDILKAHYVSHRAGTNEYKRTNTDPGTWCTSTWTIQQVATIPQQT